MNRHHGFFTRKDRSRDPNYYPFYEESLNCGLKPYEIFAYLRVAQLTYRNNGAITIAEIASGRVSNRTAIRSINILLKRGMIEPVMVGDRRKKFRLVKPSEWELAASRAAAPVDKVEKVKRQITPRLRFQVLRRDGFRCGYCGTTAAESKLTVDHIHPFSKGGKCTMENLKTACEECNSGKGATIL